MDRRRKRAGIVLKSRSHRENRAPAATVAPTRKLNAVETRFSGLCSGFRRLRTRILSPRKRRRGMRWATESASMCAGVTPKGD
jgi:hypothetical protein